MHLQLVSAEADQTMHLGATRVGLRSTRRAQARAAVHAGSVLDPTRRKSSAGSVLHLIGLRVNEIPCDGSA